MRREMSDAELSMDGMSATDGRWKAIFER
jgi:hypothetical protein